MPRTNPSADTWRAWRTHLAGQGTTLALAAGLPDAAQPSPSARWSGPALLPMGLLSGRFAPTATVPAHRAAAPAPAAPAGSRATVRAGTLALDDDGLRWAGTDGTEASLAWADVASAEVVRAWWRSRAGIRITCHDGADLWFDAPHADGIDKALDAALGG